MQSSGTGGSSNTIGLLMKLPDWLKVWRRADNSWSYVDVTAPAKKAWFGKLYLPHIDEERSLKLNKMLWPKDMSEAKSLQEELKKRLVIAPLGKMPRNLAGVDAAFFGSKVFAAACLFTYPALEPIEDSSVTEEAPLPYVPGFLAFREGRAIIRALQKLKRTPDLLIVDGHGIAHPRGMGMASQLGILLDVPAIGCAKSRLIGGYEKPKQKKGDWSPLEFNNEIIGAVLRTRPYVKPVFVSPGHKIDLAGSIEIVMNCIDKYRIPEPLREADMMSKKLRRIEIADSARKHLLL